MRSGGVTGTVLITAGMLHGLAALAAGQAVTVRTIDVDSRQPIAGAIVRLIDERNGIVGQGLTGSSGRLVLGAPSAGVYRLRADRIGHRGVEGGPFSLLDTLTVLVEMPSDLVQLPDLVVEAGATCEATPDAASTADLWAEIRKALESATMTVAGQRVGMAVRRYRKHLSPSGTLRSDSTLSEFRTRGAPFAGEAPALLRREGFIRKLPGGGYRFSGLDATTLMSDEFLAGHCFRLARAPAGSRLIGLAFRPARDVRVPDVAGTLWVDAASAELRTLEFRFVNAPPPVAWDGIGGRVEYMRLSTGDWIVRDWYIRSADLVSIVGRGRFGTASRDTVLGFVDEGGSTRPLDDLAGPVTELAPVVRTVATVRGDIRLRLISPDSLPIPGASIRLTDPDTVITTDAAGRVEARGLIPGRHPVAIRAVGYQPAVVVLALGGDTRLLDTTLVLPRIAQRLDSLVVNAAAAAPFVAGKMIDVERRQRAGLGRFLSKAQLHDPLSGGLETQLRRFGRLRVAPLCSGRGYGVAAASRTPPPVPVVCQDGSRLLDCFMAVYLDGALYWSPDMGNLVQPPDLSTISPLHLEAAEVYRGVAEVPIEYGGPSAGCGVLLLWTRVG